MCFVNSSGWAVRLDDLSQHSVHASKLLGPDEKAIR